MDAPKGKKNGKDHVDFAEAEAAIKDDVGSIVEQGTTRLLIFS